MSGALQAVFQNLRSFGAPPGQQAYTTAGTYTWVAPAGVTSVSVVAVGGGGRRGGGGLGYKNNISVSSGSSYSIQVGQGGNALCGTLATDSYFCNTGVVKGGLGAGAVGGNFTGDGGGNGGGGCFAGGGAGGYSGNGGGQNSAGASNSGAAGGGGFASGCRGYGGGGVGILGKGATGAVNQGGSGGGNPNFNSSVRGGLYGGGGSTGCGTGNGAGANGAVRIIWPGNTRSFPSTCTGNL